MGMKTRYVVGFAFSSCLGYVTLIKKKRPEWQAGLLNGIGGHIKPSELQLDAMSREFQEETGVCSDETNWDHFATLNGEDFEVCCYCSNSIDLELVKTTTDEEVVVMDIRNLSMFKCVKNLSWLLPLAVDFMTAVGMMHVEVKYE